MAKGKTKTKTKAGQVKGKTKDKVKAGQARTTAGTPAGASAVPCALCRRPVRHEPGPGKAAAALTDHYNGKHHGDERLTALADGTGKVQRAASPAYL
jgi:hypothetical protein